MMIADFDTKMQHIENILQEEAKHLQMYNQIKTNKGVISSELQHQMINILQSFQEKGRSLHRGQIVCVATESLRMAKNSEELIRLVQQKLQIKIKVIDEIEESKLGFVTAIVRNGYNSENVLCLDCGDGSFQVSLLHDDQIECSYQAVGNQLVKMALIQSVKKMSNETAQSPNPVSKKEFMELTQLIIEQLKDLPDLFQQRMKQSSTVVLGLGIPTVLPFALKKNNFTAEELKQCILTELIDKPDQFFVQKYPFLIPKLVISSFTYVYCLMKKFNIRQISTFRSLISGNCTGLMQDTKYWQSNLNQSNN